jgi:pantoate--beta-alanine ligase
MRVIRTITELRQAVALLRADAKKIALVPTMGALHDGHMSLVKMAQHVADCVIVTIFVNPTQFGPAEDFSKYPRQEIADLALLTEHNVQIAYVPDVTEMYQPGFATTMQVGGVSGGLCGAVRPGHFDGVALVVTKLLLQAAPDIAIFGEKDYQQLMVIKRLASDLDIPVEIMGAPILREKDGLALSSRNVYLTDKERRIAPELYKCLQQCAAALTAGGEVTSLLENAISHLLSAGFSSVDYMELRDAATLAPCTHYKGQPARLLVAARLGSCRLIDNIELTT